MADKKIMTPEEKGFTASEFKTAHKQGWEKQYRYKVGKKKEYLTSSVAPEKGYGAAQNMWMKGVSQSMFEARV